MRSSVQFLVRTVLVVVALSLSPLSAMAMALSDYVADAIDASPLVREKVHVYRQALQDKESSLSGWRPSVDLEGTVSHVESDTITNNSQSDDYNSNIIELAVTQNLFNGFDTENSVKQADARIQAALYDIYDTADNVALEAVQAYFEVLKQKRLYALAQDNVASHEETLRQIIARNESGASRRSELEQTEGRVARAFASMLAQYNNLEDSLTRLHEILGRHIDIADFSDPIMPEGFEQTLDSLTNRALLNHPALKVSQYNIEAARHNHRRAKKSFYPKVDVRLAQEINDNVRDSRDNDDELSLSLTLSYNLYNGGADKAERQKRVSNIAQEQQFEGRVRRQIINTLRLAHKADELLQKQLMYLDRHVVKSQETMVSYTEEFFVGERDLIDLLDAKNEVNSAQNSYSEAYYDALAARFRIYEGVGSLFQPLGIDIEVVKDDLRVSQIKAKGMDTIDAGLNMDFDDDQVLDRMDQCDNSLKGAALGKFGCATIRAASTYHANTPPVANNDEFNVGRNSVLKMSPASLMDNDSDAESAQLKFVGFSQPQLGAVALDGNGLLVFRAADGYVGTDRFSYSIADERGATATADVVIQIPERISLSESLFVNFEYNSAALTEGSKLIFDQILRALKESPDLTLNVFTYTDSKGSERFNLSLSERRADAIIDAFYAEGVDPKRFFVKAMGEQNPIADNETEEGRAINRRGEFVLRQ
jgi:outer membrane protein, adhesin transport system